MIICVAHLHTWNYRLVCMLYSPTLDPYYYLQLAERSFWYHELANFYFRETQIRKIWSKKAELPACRAYSEMVFLLCPGNEPTLQGPYVNGDMLLSPQWSISTLWLADIFQVFGHKICDKVRPSTKELSLSPATLNIIFLRWSWRGPWRRGAMEPTDIVSAEADTHVHHTR